MVTVIVIEVMMSACASSKSLVAWFTHPLFNQIPQFLSPDIWYDGGILFVSCMYFHLRPILLTCTFSISIPLGERVTSFHPCYFLAYDIILDWIRMVFCSFCCNMVRLAQTLSRTNLTVSHLALLVSFQLSY